MKLSDPLPSGTGINWSIDGGTGADKCSIAGKPPTETLNCAFGDLASGASFTVHVVSATTSGTSGTFDNTATATSANAPDAVGKDSVVVEKPSLAITKTADETSVSSGDPIGFTVTVSDGQGRQQPAGGGHGCGGGPQAEPEHLEVGRQLHR